MYASTLLGCLVGAHLALSQSYDYGFDFARLTRRADVTDPIVVQRLPPSANGSMPLRMEMRDMKKDEYKWDLYILALSMFQYVNQDDSLSYYQIAGIHGVPFQAWNNISSTPPGSPPIQAGYCPHSAILFPTWHRPYLALFEQQMYKMANAIATLFTNATERQLYQNAASDFRIPYWDWASPAPAGETHFPSDFWSPVLSQRGPNGVQNIRNPLYSYPFHPLDEDAMIWNPLKQWNETKRAPDTSVSMTEPPSMNDQVNAALLSKLPEIQQRLFVLFSNYHDYNSFSNKAWAVSKNLSSVDSIEAVHDIIHIYGGSKGHMTYVPLSSFDPLFFLHHAMTDRLVAMWQILNPDSWMSPMAAGETTFTATKGTVQSSNTPLAPFLSSNDGSFWDSDMARTTQAFGYAYADTDTTGISSEDLRQTLIQNITVWYGGASPLGLLAKSRKSGSSRRDAKSLWKREKRAASYKTSRPNVKFDAEDPPVSKVINNGSYTEWVANVHVNVEALDGSFGIHLFIGEPPENSYEWEDASNLAGSVGIFAMDRMTGSDSKISGSVPLTSALMKMVAAGDVAGLDPEPVVPFLEDALKFTVMGSDGKSVAPKRVDGLYVGISSWKVKVPESDMELPSWGEAELRVELWGHDG